MRRTGPIRVLIVDDSALVRTILTRVLAQARDIEVAGGAKDPYEARELIIEYRPDVIILDIEMPRMNGITFLKKLMMHYPVPVIMCSGVAPANSRNAIEAIENGAIDVVAKPTTGGSAALRALGEELADKVRAAAASRPAPPPVPVVASRPPTTFKEAGISPQRYIVAVGASTGGTNAINDLLSHCPPDFPPVAIVQHMPEGFTQSFAQRLDHLCPLKVTEAVDGDVLVPGKVFLARGGAQMTVRTSGMEPRIAYAGSKPVNRHCPSVDVLFDSLAGTVGKRLVGILLTGMGADGARGLLNLRECGAVTLAQDQGSCVVYGMPKVAVEMGAVQHQAPPADMPGALLQLLQKDKTAGQLRNAALPARR